MKNEIIDRIKHVKDFKHHGDKDDNVLETSTFEPKLTDTKKRKIKNHKHIGGKIEKAITKHKGKESENNKEMSSLLSLYYFQFLFLYVLLYFSLSC